MAAPCAPALPTYASFSDESSLTEARYRSIAIASFPDDHMKVAPRRGAASSSTSSRPGRACGVAFLALLTLTGGAVSGQTPDWRLFHSSTGIVARYPANWVRFGASRDQLQLRSSPGGREGVIIEPGQALLTLVEPKDAPAKTLEGVVKYFTQGVDSVTTRREPPSDTARQGCQQLREVVSWEPIVPREGAGVRPPEVVNTEYFCKVGSRIVVTVVRNYADDPHTAEYRAIGLQVVRRIRIVPSSRPGH